MLHGILNCEIINVETLSGIPIKLLYKNVLGHSEVWQLTKWNIWS